MTKRTAFFFVFALLVWSYFARPVYDSMFIASGRLKDKVSARVSKLGTAVPYEDVVALNTQAVQELEDYLQGLRLEANDAAEIRTLRFDSTADYAVSTKPLLEKLKASLLYPPPSMTTGDDFAGVRAQTLGEDELAVYSLLQIPSLPGVNSLGILILPKKYRPPFPLIVSAHGRGGMPEKTPYGKIPIMQSNPRDLAHGAIERGWAVYEPLYVFYGKDKPDNIRELLALRAQEAGTTLPAIELAKTIRALDYLSTRPEIDPKKIAMVGISYGGFNALYSTALDPRIGIAVVAAYFNDREQILDSSEPDGFLDWRFANSAGLLRDANIAALVCPRPLQIQAGIQDQLFPIAGARRTAPLAQFFYRKLQIESRFRFLEFVGRHDFNGEEAWKFIAAHWADAGSPQNRP